MTIYVDSTELRKGTRLPPALMKRVKELPELESRTGADLLVSTLNRPASSDYLLRQHTEAGILIQRKSGMDFPASITNGRLDRSLDKMKQWSPRPWLVICAMIENRAGTAVVNGRDSLSYAALIGALDWWQLRGGYWNILSDDNSLTFWVSKWMDYLRTLKKEPHKQIHRPAQQVLIGEGKAAFLSGLPGVGPERAKLILDSGGGKPGIALCNLMAGARIPGVGPVTRQRAQEWLGLLPMERLIIASEDWFGDLASYLLDHTGGKWPDAAAQYAALMETFGVPCSGMRTWGQWLEKTLKVQQEGDD